VARYNEPKNFLRRNRDLTEKEAYDDLLSTLTKNPETLYLLYPITFSGTFGDFFVYGGLLQALALKVGKKKIVYICNERYKCLGVTFDGVDIHYLNAKQHELVCSYIKKNNLFESEHYFWGWLYKKDANGKVIRDFTVPYLTEVKKNVLDIPLDAAIQAPKFIPLSSEEKFKLHSKYFINKQSTIILCPYARSSRPLPNAEGFWKDLVTNLNKITPPNRLCIYTNVKDDSQPVIEGTLPISATVQETFYIAENSLCVIGQISGFMQFLSMSKAKTFIVDAALNWRYDLKLLFPFASAQQVYLTSVSALNHLKGFSSRVSKALVGDKDHFNLDRDKFIPSQSNQDQVMGDIKSQLDYLNKVINNKENYFADSNDSAIKFITNAVKKLIE